MKIFLVCLIVAFMSSGCKEKVVNESEILIEKDEHKKNSYLALCYFVLRTIIQAADVLAFEIPEKM